MGMTYSGASMRGRFFDCLTAASSNRRPAASLLVAPLCSPPLLSAAVSQRQRIPGWITAKQTYRTNLIKSWYTEKRRWNMESLTRPNSFPHAKGKAIAGITTKVQRRMRSITTPKQQLLAKRFRLPLGWDSSCDESCYLWNGYIYTRPRHSISSTTWRIYGNPAEFVQLAPKWLGYKPRASAATSVHYVITQLGVIPRGSSRSFGHPSA